MVEAALKNLAAAFLHRLEHFRVSKKLRYRRAIDAFERVAGLSLTREEVPSQLEGARYAYALPCRFVNDVRPIKVINYEAFP